MASLTSLETTLRKALLDMGVTGVPIRPLTVAVRAGNTDEVIRLLNISPEDLSGVLAELQQIYLASGVRTLTAIPEGLVGQVAFGLTNPDVTEFMAAKTMGLIKDIGDEQRRIIRSVMTEVTANRMNPLAAVKDLVGVPGPAGRRVGSVIGLTEAQFEYVKNARKDLQHPSTYNNYLDRKRRDKRFDKAILKAQKEGRALPSNFIDRITNAYKERLVRYRAEVIARTEHKEAVERARHAAISQMVDRGNLAEQDVKRVWDSTGGDRVRDTHRAMDEQAVGLNEPFVSPRGARLMFPGDTSLGAPVEEVAQCRCVVRIEIDYYAALKRKKANG